MTADSEKNPLVVEGFESTIDLPSGRFAVRASFEAKPGERLALFSPSGSGKTTLLRWMAGVSDSPSSGALRLGNRRLDSLPPERRELGIVFQDYALFPKLSAIENVAFGLEMRGVSRSERHARSAEWLDRLGLKNRSEIPAGLLSGGEKQRVALARALIWKPSALLLDEPFSALDLAHRKKARELVRSVIESTPIPAIFITHDPEDVSRLATRTLEYSASEDGTTHVFGSA